MLHRRCRTPCVSTKQSASQSLDTIPSEHSPAWKIPVLKKKWRRQSLNCLNRSPRKFMNNDAAPVRTSPSAGTDAMGDPLAKAKSSLVETGAGTDPHPKAKKVSFEKKKKKTRVNDSKLRDDHNAFTPFPKYSNCGVTTRGRCKHVGSHLPLHFEN